MAESKSFEVDYQFYENKVWVIIGCIISFLITILIYLWSVWSLAKYLFGVQFLDFYYAGLIVISYFIFLSIFCIKWVSPLLKINKIVINDTSICFYKKQIENKIEFECIKKIQIKIATNVISSERRIHSYLISTEYSSYSLVILGKSKLLETDEFHLDIMERLNLNNKRYKRKKQPSNRYESTDVIIYDL